jgi:hypothetical protein
MDPARRVLVAVLLLVLLLWGAWHFYAGRGLVTLEARDEPVGRVLAAISRQGGIEIASNLDPETKVTLQVRRMPPLEALDTVAVRTGASWRLAYLGAPDKAAVDKALSEFRAGRDNPTWTSHGGGGFSLVEPESGEALDLRRVRWNPSGGGPLPEVMQDAAEKTGVFLAAPADWRPEVARPAGGRLSAAAPQLFRRAGGVGREVFLVRGRGGSDEEAAGGWRGGDWIGRAAARTESGGRGGGWMGRLLGDPAKLAERVEAQIALLPAAEQPKARENFAKMRDLWESVRELPEDQRMAKVREFLTSPEMAEAMENRRLSRWAKMTPEQRIERTRNYWERKAGAQNRDSR